MSERKKYQTSATENAAWKAFNESYNAPLMQREAYRQVGFSLMRQAVSERITELFAYSDQQNSIIDMGLKTQGLVFDGTKRAATMRSSGTR